MLTHKLGGAKVNNHHFISTMHAMTGKAASSMNIYIYIYNRIEYRPQAHLCNEIKIRSKVEFCEEENREYI